MRVAALRAGPPTTWSPSSWAACWRPWWWWCWWPTWWAGDTTGTTTPIWTARLQYNNYNYNCDWLQLQDWQIHLVVSYRVIIQLQLRYNYNIAQLQLHIYKTTATLRWTDRSQGGIILIQSSAEKSPSRKSVVNCLDGLSSFSRLRFNLLLLPNLNIICNIHCKAADCGFPTLTLHFAL